MTTTQQGKARAFRSLHTAARPLALANAWDVASARIVEAAGASAVATTSAGVAWSLGRPDGDALTRAEAVAAIARIAAAVTVPVTADIEAGYGDDEAGVAQTVREVLAAGAVGVNIEDGTRPPAALAARLATARATAAHEGVDLFLNARVDTYLFGLGPDHDRLEDTLERARVYVDAGADGVFVPGVGDLATIEELAAGIPVPLNVMAGPGVPSVAELGAVGVARVSLGSGVAQAAYATARRAAGELLASGGYDALADGLDFADVNSLSARG
ncbi:isocitrate lyase/phosphoenolpyruvate mutase family protein [Streptomyces sp. SID8379]|uniref:isocitrate lyase/PEP mutase family protein n=1 Tax=unclassified Streptomyces TaxID=2593676 RepID=UPI0003704CCF|nr:MULTISPECIES: isocitrate lyase/phosphoenolpyruvate mutase family protein [unclassified Streptomyces]MYW69428.1 isocitrate lyase/phosphoenolpyruvate mutase family protein [Streptomyces sp. SID8379]